MNHNAPTLFPNLFFLCLSILDVILAKDLSISFHASFITESVFREKRLTLERSNEQN